MLKEVLFKAIDSNTQLLLDTVRGLSEEQLQRRPAGKWSVLEQLEHIVLTDRVVDLLLMREPNSMAETDTIIGQERLEKIIVTLRARKVAAPDLLLPKGHIKTISAFEEQFTKQREAFKTKVENGQIILNRQSYKHPYLGEMTVIDWYHFIPLHAQRHLEQIKDILSSETTR